MLPRIFVDSYIKKCNDRVINVAQRLSYMAIACEEMDTSEQIEYKIKVIPKVVIRAEKTSELKDTLSRVNYRRVFVTVEPLSVEVARWASHDTRIDTIILTRENTELFDKKQASIMKQYSKPLEIPVLPLLQSIKSTSVIYRRIRLFMVTRVPLVVSTMATQWYELIHPKALIAVLEVHFDIPRHLGLLALADIPRRVISAKEAE